MFESFVSSSSFEQFSNSRQGAIIVAPTDQSIPIVRTTAVYKEPSQHFLSIHYDLVNKIKGHLPDLNLNNAMVEIYDHIYRTMKFHSDQALDLEEDSYICLFSCYEDESEKHLRKLKIKKKCTGIQTEVILEHNSVVIFSKKTNDEHLHRIVLEHVGTDKDHSSKWLGITFRLSKTFVYFKSGSPYFTKNDKPLVISTEDERKEFYKMKSLENSVIGYSYPEISYTLSHH